METPPPTKTLKRKRVSSSTLTPEEKESKIQTHHQEISSLINYFNEICAQNQNLNLDQSPSSPINSLVSCFLEESNLPFSKLVDQIYERVKTRHGITLASVRSTVLLVGQRSMYGIANADADVLEDSSQNCLWCWETRDLKLLPKTQRALLNIRRACRKKIHDRITALSAMISSLQLPNDDPSYKIDMTKALEKLAKTLNEAEIRLLVENMLQRSGAEIVGKEAKLKEKGLIKELERNKRELEKEKKRMDREQLKEKLQNEKELKRLQDEAEKEERRREKEEAEIRKQLKRQQEEVEKDLKRKEKEEAELRKKLSLQKQATIMERFLKSKKNTSADQDDPSPTKVKILDTSKKGDVEMLSAVTLSMDSALYQKNCCVVVEDPLGLHRDAWNKLGHSIRLGISRHWGMRHNPKTEVSKELKLQWSSSEIGLSEKVTDGSKRLVRCDDFNTRKLADGWEEAVPDARLSHTSVDGCIPDMRVCNRRKKLLQFDKSYRPAYYGTLSVKSDVVGPRHPFKKDPNLHYDVESDEEWEEEDPGESLSDFDGDDGEENLEEGNIRSQDEDGSEDGFLVPDGYLSDNEGVQVDRMETDDEDYNSRSSSRCKQDVESEEFRTFFRQQKYINNLTEHALQKNQLLIISNLMHEKTGLVVAEGLSGTAKLEQICLQALSIRPFPGGEPLEISVDHTTLDEDQEVCQSKSKGGTPLAPTTVMLDKDLPKIVCSIQSCSHGINKVIESLQQSFPSVPKSQLRNKVREISNFVDNRWQVKKDVLDKLGLSSSPGKCGGERTKGIAAFFSKRCMPPTSGPIKAEETSQPCLKHETLCHEQGCTENVL